MDPFNMLIVAILVSIAQCTKMAWQKGCMQNTPHPFTLAALKTRSFSSCSSGQEA